VSLRMLTNLRLADLRLTTAQQRTTGQNLPPDLYRRSITIVYWALRQKSAVWVLEVEVEVELLPTVSRPVRLGVRHSSGNRYQFLCLLEIFFRQLRVCYFVAPSLARGQVCNLLLLLVLASSAPRESIPYFIVPVLETSPTWRARSPYLYPPLTGWLRCTPGHWVPFPSPLTSCRATMEVFYSASTRDKV
jgi:hypothetical protein